MDGTLFPNLKVFNVLDGKLQKVLGALVRQVGAIDAWSDWLVVVEYVIDNTPGSHGYTTRLRIWRDRGACHSLLRRMC